MLSDYLIHIRTSYYIQFDILFVCEVYDVQSVGAAGGMGGAAPPLY